MEQFSETFIEGYCEERFDEFLSDSTLYLKKNNVEYALQIMKILVL